jgi:rubrerythrin
MGFMDSVKGFAGKVGETVSNGAKSVSDGSKKLAEKSRVKKEIAQLEAEVEQSFSAIGKAYFEENKDKADDKFAASFADIAAKREKADKLRQLLASMEDKWPCPQCGAEVTKGQKFCDNCGAKVEAPEAPVIAGYTESAPAAEAPAGKACPNCGAHLDEGQNFCEKCGTRI